MPERVWRRENLLHRRWEGKLVQPLQRTAWRCLTKRKIKLPYDPAAPLWSVYPDKTVIRKRYARPDVIAAPFTTGQDRRRPSRLTREQIKSGACLQWDILQQSETLLFQWEGPRDYHSEWSKPDRKRWYHMMSFMELGLKKYYLWAYLWI